ncbi:hypothetical protein HG535_0A06340 [Zygotorulaspora mrakii]|uniref:Uncharacterized protein n=1 Tax=Zygotorulaspora mrakii TaxID=42260 RepID=A0A7H9AYP6_ZYGMR|nr:uncharacterized protein HG535_0A06340 [Zygotorulaspora mrakii]QLG70692.1 hypothetical protein HG535_0A06340 [Zygotorulaspora mrakii]
MRAPPPPRRSRVRFFTVYVSRLRQFCTLYKIKKRWKLHKLHTVERRGYTIVSPLSAIRADDMVNLPTGLQNKSHKKKPLLIASFPRGCSRSPRVKLLQRNRLSKIFLSRRKYNLKYFDVTGIKEKNCSSRQSCSSYHCAHVVRTIKKVTSKNADVRVIFHDNNTIKSHNLPINTENIDSPQLLEFGPHQSIRIKNYSTLDRKNRQGLLLVDETVKHNISTPRTCSPTITRYFEEERMPKVTYKKPTPRSFILLTKFKDLTIISHSIKINSSE